MPAVPKTEDPGPLRAAHTPNFPALFRQLGQSLLVTTYQAGKLVMVRDEGDHLNSHYRAFPAPMGLALANGGSKLAIGTTIQVWEFRDVPRRRPPLETNGTHDACYLPRSSHVTGNVLIHEMAYGAGEHSGSSTPASLAWPRSTVSRANRAGGRRPSPSWNRRIAATSTAWPWWTASRSTSPRWAKRTKWLAGGPTRPGAACLMDVDSNAILCRGLSMPHSPRWYGGRLWVCESGWGRSAMWT